MNESLPRYDVYPDGMMLDKAGDWCKWEDVATLLEERDQLREEHDSVIDLGNRFCFQHEPFSVSQVITHAVHLQYERARLLFDNCRLRKANEQLKEELAEARKVK